MIHPRRSFIFTPGLKPNMFPMASASGSDIVCVELEDGIAPRDKAKARKHALALYDTQQANDGVELIVRINSLREQFGIEDVAAILATDTPPPALILPKAAARFSLVYLPCVVRAAVRRARPSSVLGPVDFPPCREQRPLRLYAGLWQGVPLRVLAPQRWPGQSGPKRHGMPFSRLLFVMLKSPPRMGFHYTPYMQVVRGLGGLTVI